MKYSYLIILVIFFKLFGAIQTDNQSYFDYLPPEIICRLIVTQESEETLKDQLNKVLVSNKFKKNIVPGYQLLMTCKTFYFNKTIKNRLIHAISQFSLVINNYIFLNCNFFSDSAIKTEFTQLTDVNNIEKYKAFFEKNANNFFYVKIKSGSYLTLSEFLLLELRYTFSRTSFKYGYNYPMIELNRHILPYIEFFELICLNLDLCLRSLISPEKTIAEFLLHHLKHDFDSFDISFNAMIIDQTLIEKYKKRYKKRNNTEVIPEKVSTDLSLLLSDEAFEKLQDAVNNPEKKILDKKLLNWILPEIPEIPELSAEPEKIPKILTNEVFEKLQDTVNNSEKKDPEKPQQPTQFFFYKYFIQKICYIYKSILNKIEMLITMIQKSFYNHI